MENRKDEKNAPWMLVPQFGDWDQKGPLPDYSLDFSKIRQMRKQNKRDISRASIGNEEELISSNTSKLNTTNNSAPTHHSYDDHHHSPTGLWLDHQEALILYLFFSEFLVSFHR